MIKFTFLYLYNGPLGDFSFVAVPEPREAFDLLRDKLKKEAF